MSVFGVILVRIFLYSDWIRTRITPNTDTFYAVYIVIKGAISEEYSEPSRTAKIELFAEVVNSNNR